MARGGKGSADGPLKRSREGHEAFMGMALEEARKALHIGEVPVGAVLVLDNDVVAAGFNQPIRALDPSAHAEIVALRGASRALGNYRLPGATLYVTVEPCLMCVGALVQARVAAVVFGAVEPKFGALKSVLKVEELSLNHRFQVVEGILEPECRRLLQEFFKFRRKET
jgi:tRNA(adenine34) deaminase